MKTSHHNNPESELGVSVLRSACNAEAKDLAVEWGEFGLDALLGEDVLKHAPMLGTIVKICGISKTIRDRLFARKVWEFLRASPKFTEKEREDFVREELDDPQRARRLSEAIVLILERLDDLQKTEMLAKIFAAFVRRKIDYGSFRRLTTGLERAFVDDLKSFVAGAQPGSAFSEEFLSLLEPSGFAKTSGGVTRFGSLGTETYISPLGKLFQTCMREE